jgi:hypothetical protein
VSHQRVVNYALRTASVATVFGLCAVVAALAWPKTAEYLWLAVIIPLSCSGYPLSKRGWRPTGLLANHGCYPFLHFSMTSFPLHEKESNLTMDGRAGGRFSDDRRT